MLSTNIKEKGGEIEIKKNTPDEDIVLMYRQIHKYFIHRYNEYSNHMFDLYGYVMEVQ